MGEIADMMLDGTLCTVCGAVIDDGNAKGYPVKCEDCIEEEKKDKLKNNKKSKKLKGV